MKRLILHIAFVIAVAFTAAAHPVTTHRTEPCDSLEVQQSEDADATDSMQIPSRTIDSKTSDIIDTIEEQYITVADDFILIDPGTMLRWAKYIIIGLLLILTALIVCAAIVIRKLLISSSKLRSSNILTTSERNTLLHAKSDLEKAYEQARAAERIKTEFINTISHEIKEPANVILGYSRILVDSADSQMRPSMEKFIRIIEMNSLQLRTIVNDVLDVAELDSSSVVLRNKNISMKLLAEVASEPLRSQLNDGVSMDVVPILPDDEYMCIDVDPARALQVITNLISNAVKFTDKGRITVYYGRNEVSGVPCFIVEDTGPGIPPDKVEAIFNQFYKLSRHSRGVGLGLHICRKVSRLLGGEVTLDQEYTNGARFIFFIFQTGSLEQIRKTLPN